MSEIKTNEPVKQEGDFKIKSKKRTPKKLVLNEPEVTKVNIKEPSVELPPEITKVVIPSDALKQTEDAIQIGETEKVVVEEQTGNSAKVDEQIQESKQDVEEFKPIQEVTDKITREVKEAVRDEKVLGKALPENIEKLVTFMEDTGGTIEDYTRLNADYSSIDENVLLKEYYKKAKPHLDSDEIDFIMEENFHFDTDLDEYYDEIKLRPGVTQDQQKALDFFNRYNEQQDVATEQHEAFKKNTKELFNDEFKGFDIKVGEKSYKYNIQNREKVAENQSNINNLVKKFLNEDGDVVDTSGYHKAMYAAENVDKIASHFYEQGKADAVKDVINKSKNLTDTKARTGSSGDISVGGFKVKAISGFDSKNLKIKTRKFN